MASSFTLFETAIGTCAIVWTGRGVAGVQLPETSEDATRARVVRRFQNARSRTPGPDVQSAVDGIVALLRGEPSDLSSIALDLEGVEEFHRRVYGITRAIPRGTTLSYGDIAARLELPGAARAVGQALGRNPTPLIVPCHRVLAAGRKVGGFSAPGGQVTKRRLLAIEGAFTDDAPSLFD